MEGTDLMDRFRVLMRSSLEIRRRIWIDPNRRGSCSTQRSENLDDSPGSADLIGRTRELMNLMPLMIQTDSSWITSVVLHGHLFGTRIDVVTNEQHGDRGGRTRNQFGHPTLQLANEVTMDGDSKCGDFRTLSTPETSAIS